MSALAKLETALYPLQCGTCGVWHAIPQTMFDSCKREGGYWHCPNGHSRGFSKGSDRARIEQLEAELQRQQQLAERNLRRANDANAAVNHLQKQLKGTKTRLKNVKSRVANGVCPCCNRSFANLQRHMHTKHPEFNGDAS